MSDKRVEKKESQRTFSRRLFMKGVGSGVVSASAISTGIVPGAEQEAQASADGKILGPGLVSLKLNVNGQTYTVKAEPRETLLEVLRNRLDLTGSKLVCDRGSCGACTVLMDGKPVYGCMVLAIKGQGKKITTIEGLAKGEKLHPVQEAFVECDAVQCGFCTSGFILSMSAVFDKNPRASLDEVKQGISGNICRCGTYSQIFDAAETARKKIGG